jgi:hypothetical protein
VRGAEPGCISGGFERPGLYLGAGGLAVLDDSSSVLRRELQSTLDAPDVHVDVSDNNAGGARLGVRVLRDIALELEGEPYNNLHIDGSVPPLAINLSAKVRLWSMLLTGKGFLLTGRYQPSVMLGAGYAVVVSASRGGRRSL